MSQRCLSFPSWVRRSPASVRSSAASSASCCQRAAASASWRHRDASSATSSHRVTSAASWRRCSVTSRAFRILLDRVCCGCDGRCEASVVWCGCVIDQLVAPVSLKFPAGTEGWLDDRRTRGVAELREETPWRGAIPVGARGGFGVNREIAGEISGMADRRDWGGGGDNPEESTQRMIERIWESLTDIRARMDQQAPVPPVAVPPGDGEAIPVAPVPPRVEVTFAAPMTPPPPVLIAEESMMQVEKFLRLQPPTYSGGPNPDTAKHWVHEIERVFATMRCPAADRVVLAAYQLRGFALEWWRLKMQTTFAGRTEEAITWSEFLDVFNTFFLIQVQQVKREQFRTLQQERVASLNCARKRRGVVQFPWELAEGSLYLGVCPRLLYFYSVIRKFGYRGRPRQGGP
ncbi:hypothetical protein Taro_008290 [Colocasia esculenta]|uniref:Retrotransposon gag domain-containing protein n=1 Tax=Colocasia esculenta TaxID=4460 RepID=A0A843TX71_COLES|nr:hypothetical protein [Colocasia esculenta]